MELEHLAVYISCGCYKFMKSSVPLLNSLNSYLEPGPASWCLFEVSCYRLSCLCCRQNRDSGNSVYNFLSRSWAGRVKREGWTLEECHHWPVLWGTSVRCSMHTCKIVKLDWIELWFCLDSHSNFCPTPFWQLRCIYSSQPLSSREGTTGGL